MFGAAVSCNVEFPPDMKAMLAPPTSARANSSVSRPGAPAASARTAPNATHAATSIGTPVRPRAATSSPPTTAPTPIAAVMKPYPVAPAWSASAITGSVTWNSYASAPTRAIITSGTASSGVERT